jgi:pimeloyl-ACP methyl ester carboxylesterase
MAILVEKTLNAAGYKCRSILHVVTGVPIVFLHGLSYSSEIWNRIGVTALLIEKRVPFLALDMPYGIKSECQPKTRSPEKNVAYAREALKDVFGEQASVLVGASIGGRIALKYACHFPVKGLLLIGPGGALEEELVKSYSRFNFPVRIVWGAEDNIISGEDMRLLSEKLPNATLVTYEDAGHSAYVSKPNRFIRDLLELYAASERNV